MRLDKTRPLSLVHIGKCGGSTIKSELLKTGKPRMLELASSVYHAVRPCCMHNDYHIVAIRNPIHRFVSAFYHVYSTLLLCRTKEPKCSALVKNHLNIFNRYQTANKLAEDLYDAEGNLNSVADFLITRNDLPSVDRIVTYNPTFGIPYRVETVIRKGLDEDWPPEKGMLIQKWTLFNTINEEDAGSQHMDNHLGMNISWCLKYVLARDPQSIVGVITTEHMAEDMKRLFSVEITTHKNKHTQRGNWGSQYDANLSVLAKTNLRRYLAKDYECLLKLKDLDLITDEYYNYCMEKP